MGSLSWFATVYLEMHVGFAAAYGLTLCFVVVAAATTLVGRRWYGTFALSAPAVEECTHAL